MPSGFCCDFLEAVRGCFTYSALVNGTLMTGQAKRRVFVPVAKDVQPKQQTEPRLCTLSVGSYLRRCKYLRHIAFNGRTLYGVKSESQVKLSKQQAVEAYRVVRC
jgi:hypothetical protein